MKDGEKEERKKELPHIDENLARPDALPRREKKIHWSKNDQSKKSQPWNTDMEDNNWNMASLTTKSELD